MRALQVAEAPQPSLLEVEDLVVEYGRRHGQPSLRAVDGVSFTVAPGQTTGLVGESGSGKTTIGRAILGLVPVNQGVIRFDGANITRASHRQRRRLSAELQVVFQDPYGSLNPARTIGQTLAETLYAQGWQRRSANERVREMLDRVGLPREAAGLYPRNFSGGQRQRVAIARALMAQPRLVICDEPASSLDLSVQAQVLNLLRELQKELGLSYVFIAHDLPVVRYMSERLIVLYRGRIMEQGDAATVYAHPSHPYTRSLLAATPVPNPYEQRVRRQALRHATDSLAPPPAAGCPFAPRCPHAIDVCYEKQPELEATSAGPFVACHRWRELEPTSASYGFRN